MSAFWQALDWCAHHRLWTPAFLEFYGGTGGGATTPHALPLHLVSLASLLPLSGLAGCLAGWLARWLVAGWLLGWLARWLVAAWLALCLTG
jgi:hypothetical protein